MWVFKLLFALVRNQLWLRPVAWPAVWATRRIAAARGHKLKSVLLWFGLAGPEGLQVLMVFRTNAELIAFHASNHETSIAANFRVELSRGLYPKSAIEKIGIDFYSHEEIMRGGGYYFYFK